MSDYRKCCVCGDEHQTMIFVAAAAPVGAGKWYCQTHGPVIQSTPPDALVEEWRPHTEKPKQQNNIRAAKYLCVNLSGEIAIYIYVFANDQWTENGDDTQRIVAWRPLPELPAKAALQKGV